MGNNWQGGSCKGKSLRRILNSQLIVSCQCQVTGKVYHTEMYKEKYFLQATWNSSLGLAKPSLSTESSFGPCISKKTGQLEKSYRGATRCLIIITYRNSQIYGS